MNTSTMRRGSGGSAFAELLEGVTAPYIQEQEKRKREEQIARDISFLQRMAARQKKKVQN